MVMSGNGRELMIELVMLGSFHGHFYASVLPRNHYCLGAVSFAEVPR
jgi:hypothetical protein